MLSPWDVMHLEAVGQGLFFQVAKTTVWDVMERSVGEQPEKWFVVDCYSEIIATKNEMFCFVQTVGDRKGFSFDRQHDFPSCGAAKGLNAIARTVFLKEPAADSEFGPICGEARRFRFVKDADTILYLIDDRLF